MHQGTMSIHSPGEGAALMEHWIVRTGCLWFILAYLMDLVYTAQNWLEWASWLRMRLLFDLWAFCACSDHLSNLKTGFKESSCGSGKLLVFNIEDRVFHTIIVMCSDFSYLKRLIACWSKSSKSCSAVLSVARLTNSIFAFTRESIISGCFFAFEQSPIWRQLRFG